MVLKHSAENKHKTSVNFNGILRNDYEIYIFTSNHLLFNFIKLCEIPYLISHVSYLSFVLVFSSSTVIFKAISFEKIQMDSLSITMLMAFSNYNLEVCEAI